MKTQIVVRNAKSFSPSYDIDARSIIATLSGLSHHIPYLFESPTTFDPSRFIKVTRRARGEQQKGQLDKGESKVFDKGILRPWGMCDNACPGLSHAEEAVLAFVAGILALWDFKSASGDWVVPSQVQRAVVPVPLSDVRIKLRPRPCTEKELAIC